MCLDACGLVEIRYNSDIHDYERFHYFDDVQMITGFALMIIGSLAVGFADVVPLYTSFGSFVLLSLCGGVLVTHSPSQNFGSILKISGLALGVIGAIGAGFLFVPGRIALGACGAGLIVIGLGLIGLGEDFRQNMIPTPRV